MLDFNKDIILVNDNDMSIAENYGGLYDNLALLRETNGEAENNFFKAIIASLYANIKKFILSQT